MNFIWPILALFSAFLSTDGMARIIIFSQPPDVASRNQTHISRVAPSRGTPHQLSYCGHGHEMMESWICVNAH